MVKICESPAMQEFWKPMTREALVTITRIAAENHPTLPERAAVFEEKFSIFPDGCFVLENAGAIVGYGVAHPWRLNDIPKLDTFLEFLPTLPGCLFIHDVVVLPSARGRRAVEAYMALVSDLAARIGIDHLALVSVYGTQHFWTRHGFAVSGDAALPPKLASYGSNASYMVKKLLSHRQ
jgi:ribosomal protein S18 acetylase RimI-like enzyme